MMICIMALTSRSVVQKSYNEIEREFTRCISEFIARNFYDK